MSASQINTAGSSLEPEGETTIEENKTTQGTEAQLAKKKPLLPLKKDVTTPTTDGVASSGASPLLAAQAVPRPSTPNIYSAASSMIFERDVQEPSVAIDAAPAIPAHIKTEDLIPPALEASSLAITDDHLSPEEVEIITHVTHQAAATTIAKDIKDINSTQSSTVGLPPPPQDSHEQHIFHNQEELDDAAASYGTLDPNDVRRLSFISFADVVHGDQSHHSQPPSLPNDTSFSQTSQLSRPISPVLSPQSQPLSDMASPITSNSVPGSFKGVEFSPSRSMTASPQTLAASQHQRGDLAIETLGQALRKTASRDLSGFSRSPPPSTS